MAEEVRTLLSPCNQHFHSQAHRRSLEIPNTRSWFSDVPENMPLPKTFVSVEYVVHISHDRSHKTNVSNLWYPKIYLYSQSRSPVTSSFHSLIGQSFFLPLSTGFSKFCQFSSLRLYVIFLLLLEAFIISLCLIHLSIYFRNLILIYDLIFTLRCILSSMQFLFLRSNFPIYSCMCFPFCYYL